MLYRHLFCSYFTEEANKPANSSWLVTIADFAYITVTVYMHGNDLYILHMHLQY